MDWRRAGELYPVNAEKIWLNNCGTVPAGTHVVERVCEYLRGYARKGVLTETASFPGVEGRIKGILAKLLGCDPDELALIHNTAEGMNIVSHGLDVSEGDEVVLLENEYPSNVYPWRHLREKGAKLTVSPMEADPDAFFEGFRDVVTGRTRVVALSAVHWCTGAPLPLERIGSFCRERGIEFVVDGAQGVGMRPIDVRKSQVSFMAFSAWKWLMGPLGLGVLYVARDRLETLKPRIVGTGSVIRDQEYLPYKTRLKPSASRFTVSTPNFTDWVYFLASLEFLDSIGFEACMERIWELARRLADGLRSAGCDVYSDRVPGCRTGIVAFEKPDEDSEEVFRRLKDDGVVSALRLGRVRFSPHIYLSPEQLDRAVQIVAGRTGAQAG